VELEGNHYPIGLPTVLLMFGSFFCRFNQPFHWKWAATRCYKIGTYFQFDWQISSTYHHEWLYWECQEDCWRHIKQGKLYTGVSGMFCFLERMSCYA